MRNLDASFSARRGQAPFALVAGMTAALLVSAILLRGIEAPPRIAPEQRQERPVLALPMQFLGPMGARRAGELAALLPEDLRAAWQRANTSLNAQRECPPTLEWLATPRGQEFERTLAELQRGDTTQALAALVLLTDLARHTQWKAGMFRGTTHAERVGDLLQTWLARFAEQSADDVTLHEPALAAALLYGRAMRTAYNAPTIGRNAAPYERSRAVLRGLCGTQAKSQTEFGRALQARYPRAFNALTEEDFLSGAEEEARSLFPDINGTCGK